MNKISRTLLVLAVIFMMSSVCVFADTQGGNDGQVDKYLKEYNKLLKDGNDDPEKFKGNGFYFDESGSVYVMNEDGQPLVIKEKNKGMSSVTAGSQAVSSTASISRKAKSPFINHTYGHNSRFKNHKLRHGVDVSFWQDPISVSQWKKAKADGVEFAIIRVAYRGATSGTLNEDIYFRSNIKNAKKAGIKVGVYIYSQAITTSEGRAEANYILNRIKSYKLDLPVVFDYEYYPGGRLTNAHLSRTKATNIAEAFCERVKSKGYTPMIYASLSFFNDDMYGKRLSAKYPIWLAQYPLSSGVRTCQYAHDYDFWQYASWGRVNGLPGDIDSNFWYDDGTKYNTKNPKITPTKVKGVKVDKHSTNYIKISWNKATYKNKAVDGYRVYRSNRYGGTYERIATVKADTREFTDSNLNQGREYYYKVRAYVKQSSGDKLYGSKSDTLNAKTRSAYKKTCTVRMNSYLRSHPGMSYSVKKVMKKGTRPEVYRYAIAKNGKKWYRVKYVRSGKAYYGYVSAWCLKVKASTKVEKVTGISLTTVQPKYVNVRWNRQSNIKGYVIYRSTSLNGKYYSVGTKTSEYCGFRDNTIKPGKKYYYKVKAYARYNGKNYYGPFSNAKSAVIEAEETPDPDTDSDTNPEPTPEPDPDTGSDTDGSAE